MPRCQGCLVAGSRQQQQQPGGMATGTLHFANFAAFSAICGILLFNP